MIMPIERPKANVAMQVTNPGGQICNFMQEVPPDAQILQKKLMQVAPPGGQICNWKVIAQDLTYT